jgi:hypothetical protein
MHRERSSVRIEEEPLRHETFDWRFLQGPVATPALAWDRRPCHRPPLLSRGREPKCLISRNPVPGVFSSASLLLSLLVLLVFRRTEFLL